MSFMGVLHKMGRLVQLGGIVGLALGSLALTVCGGRTVGPADDAGSLDAQTVDGGVDATSESDGAFDGSSEQPDAQLWDVICE
jgi:hypothetical protein